MFSMRNDDEISCEREPVLYLHEFKISHDTLKPKTISNNDLKSLFLN